jgi:hypothetical protein
MTSVKVVGGSEMYNFCIQSFMHFCSKIWSFSGSNTVTPTRCRLERRDIARACAPVPRPHVVLPRRPRRRRAARGHPPTEAVPSPCVAPRGSSESSWGHARRLLHCTGPVRATDRCRRRPAICALAEADVPRPHLRGHAVIIPAETPL